MDTIQLPEAVVASLQVLYAEILQDTEDEDMRARAAQRLARPTAFTNINDLWAFRDDVVQDYLRLVDATDADWDIGLFMLIQDLTAVGTPAHVALFSG
jgi:hypothetical protein